MRFILYFLLCLSISAEAVEFIGTPRIVDCPSGYLGEMTVIETKAEKKPWKILKWTCSSKMAGPLQLFVLEDALNDAPPKLNDIIKTEENCPSGSVGSILFVTANNVRTVDSWTCSTNGSTKLNKEELRSLWKNKGSNFSGASGVSQEKNCPAPYQGSYVMQYANQVWSLRSWTCQLQGASVKINDSTMRLILPVQ